MNCKLTAEGIMGAAMRMCAELSGGEFPISVFPHKIQRIYIYHVLRHEVPKAVSWSELRRALRRYKIVTEFKLNRRTGEAEGVKFICNGYKFSGSKIDRQFSFVNIACRLEENAFDAGIWPRRSSTPTQQRVEPRQEVVRQEPSEECSLSVGLLDL